MRRMCSRAAARAMYDSPCPCNAFKSVVGGKRFRRVNAFEQEGVAG